MASKFAKSANPEPVEPKPVFPLLLSFWAANGSALLLENGSGVGEGVGGTGAARSGPVGPLAGRGGAGLGGGCLAFLGGSAGLGLSARVGAWRFAKGSSPKGSFAY